MDPCHRLLSSNESVEGEVGVEEGAEEEVVTDTITDTVDDDDGVEGDKDWVNFVVVSDVSVSAVTRESGGLSGLILMMLGVSWKTTCLLGVARVSSADVSRAGGSL